MQANGYVGCVGVSAAQEALSEQAYYEYHTALGDSGTFIANALELAQNPV